MKLLPSAIFKVQASFLSIPTRRVKPRKEETTEHKKKKRTKTKKGKRKKGNKKATNKKLQTSMLATQQQPNPHPHDHANESEGLDLLGTTTDSYGAAPVPVQTAVRPVPQDDTTTQPTSPEKLTVAIIGGGMGGLAAAVALGRAGVKVDLFEQAAEFAEIGAGIQWVAVPFSGFFFSFFFFCLVFFNPPPPKHMHLELTYPFLNLPLHFFIVYLCSLGPNTVRTLNQMGLGEAYDSVAETDDMGGLHFEWWNGMEDRKYGEVSRRVLLCYLFIALHFGILFQHPLTLRRIVVS